MLVQISTGFSSLITMEYIKKKILNLQII